MPFSPGRLGLLQADLPCPWQLFIGRRKEAIGGKIGGKIGRGNCTIIGAIIEKIDINV